MLLTEHKLDFLSLKGGCIASSESTLVKMPHVAAQISRYIRPDTQCFRWHIFSPCTALAFLLLAHIHWMRMFKETAIRHLYQFSNVPSHEKHSWKVDDDG